MLINEVSKRTKLTKKAIEYYALQDLVSPAILENGYRNYNDTDIEKLHKINVLRKLDISTEEIRHILNDTTNSALQNIALKKELDHQRDMLKNTILQKLSQGTSYDEISSELEAVEKSKTIIDKMLDAFPGCYGRFVCMHFARFLGEPIQTKEQKIAYDKIITFLDNLPPLDMPKDIEEYLMDGTKHMGIPEISEMLEKTKNAYQNIDEFLAENKEVIEQYLKWKKSEEYKNSLAFKLTELLTKFNSANGYNDVFIPAMKQLSFSYAEYYSQIEMASKTMLEVTLSNAL